MYQLRFYLCCFLILLAGINGYSKNTQPFNDSWEFRKAADSLGNWEKVTLPHTWNNIDMQTGKNFYQGDAWYRKSVSYNPAWKNKRVFLKFEGVGSVAEIFLNKVSLGVHKGAYSAFIIELTDVLKDSVNLLEVKVNNEARKDVIPINHFLFGIYGGIYRPVSLIVADKIAFATNDFGGPGVYVRQQHVSAAAAQLTFTAKLENKTDAAVNGVLQYLIQDARGRLVKSMDQKITILPQGLQQFQQQLTIQHPHLWNGLADPYLYKASCKIIINGKQTDEIIVPLGIRHFEIIGGKGFFLNGKPYVMHGVTRHQDWWQYGSALSNEQHAADLAIIKEMGATTIRLAHYQQSEYLYSKADSMGLIIWAEIPFVNASSRQEGDNAKQQLVELIRQCYHHPSIYVWGLHNEVYGKFKSDYVPRLTAELNNIAKTEDPDRYTVSVNGYGNMERFENRIADIQGMNRYYGWYEDKTEDLKNWVSGLQSKYPGYKVILSEYGAEANVAQQTETLPDFDPVSGQFFPEQLQTRSHEIQWGILEKQQYLVATYLWNEFDFAVPMWSRGGVASRNMKGLVTFDRSIKKDAFYWYKANWSKEPFVYISDSRLVKRKNALTTIPVYSNAGKPVLTVNGKTITSCTPGTTKVHYVFNNVVLTKGENKVSVTVTAQGKTYTDKQVITLE